MYLTILLNLCLYCSQTCKSQNDLQKQTEKCLNNRTFVKSKSNFFMRYGLINYLAPVSLIRDTEVLVLY